MARYNAMTEDFQEAVILGKPALFTPMRIDRSTVPIGYHLYEVRHDDDCRGDAVQLARNIVVNHWGSLITRDEIVRPDDGYLDINPYELNYSIGDCRSMSNFIDKYPLVIKKFAVTITETLKRVVEVEAKDQAEAEQIVSDNWNDSQYVLGVDNFASANFVAVPADEKEENNGS